MPLEGRVKKRCTKASQRRSGHLTHQILKYSSMASRANDHPGRQWGYYCSIKYPIRVTLVRLCDLLAFGVTGIITTFRNTASENGVLPVPHQVHWIMCHWSVVNLARAIEQIRYHGFFVAGLAGDGNADVSSLGRHKHLAIILGAEDGLRRLSRHHCDVLVRINIDNNSELKCIERRGSCTLCCKYALPPNLKNRKTTSLKF